jgi:hypothetical protein
MATGLHIQELPDFRTALGASAHRIAIWVQRSMTAVGTWVPDCHLDFRPCVLRFEPVTAQELRGSTGDAHIDYPRQMDLRP